LWLFAIPHSGQARLDAMKILLIPKGYLGDTILSTPLIGNLARHYPQAEIWVLTTSHVAQLLAKDPLLTGVVIYDRHGKDRGIGGMARLVRRIRPMAFDVAYIIQRSPPHRLAGIPLWHSRAYWICQCTPIIFIYPNGQI
jgi:hypothetical protein